MKSLPVSVKFVMFSWCRGFEEKLVGCLRKHNPEFRDIYSGLTMKCLEICSLGLIAALVAIIISTSREQTICTLGFHLDCSFTNITFFGFIQFAKSQGFSNV